jgi:hypothetical protein
MPATRRSMHWKQVPQWGVFADLPRQALHESVIGSRDWHLVVSSTRIASARVRVASGFDTAIGVGRTARRNAVTKCRNLGWVERLARAPTSWSFVGRLMLTGPLSAR